MQKRAFLTGASTGIGRALSRELVARGWRVALASRQAEVLESQAREIDPGRERTQVFQLDVSDTDSIAPIMERAAAVFGGLDAVIANAGVGIPIKAVKLDLKTIRQVFEVNVMGAMETLIAGLPHVRQAEHGVLVGVSSIAAWRSGPGAAPYNASKAAFSSFLEGMRSELSDLGVCVLEICPGFVKTPMTDRNDFKMPFLMPPERAASLIARAIEARQPRLSFPWQTALGMSLVRRLPDRIFDALNRRLARRILKRR